MSTYTEAVELAAAALKRGEDANWELARLTYENTLDRGYYATQRRNGKVDMAQWSADVRAASGRRFSQATGQRYKAVWAEHRSDPARCSWSEAYEAVTPAGFEERMAPSRARRVIEHGTPETKAEMARQLLAEPEVAEKVVNDNTARDNVRRALDERYDRAPKPYPVTPSNEPPLELVTEFRRTHIAMKRAVELVIERDYQISEAEREALLAEVRWLRNALDYIESGLAAGSLDKALAALLDGER